MMLRVTLGGSPSIAQPDYWWYRARADLLRAALGRYVGEPGRVLDVGSADGPSVDWLRGNGCVTALDVDPRGLTPGDVCGSAMELPFASATFDVVSAFDVLEHCESESKALSEMGRVLKPGGRLLLSVPAYQWAWTSFDDHNQHHRRYTRPRLVSAVEAAGLEVIRATYAFAGTLPFFTASRLATRVRERASRGSGSVLEADAVPNLPNPGVAITRMLLGLSRIDQRLLASVDLPAGSSVVVAARAPVVP